MAYNDASPEADECVGPIEATSRATEDKLGILHGIVAEYLTLKLASGKATAAEVGAAITYLKNNSITADPATNAALANLKGTLANRKRKVYLSLDAVKWISFPLIASYVGESNGAIYLRSGSSIYKVTKL